MYRMSLTTGEIVLTSTMLAHVAVGRLLYGVNDFDESAPSLGKQMSEKLVNWHGDTADDSGQQVNGAGASF